MGLLLRSLIIGGTLIGAWRLVVRLQTRPTYPPAGTYIHYVDAVDRSLGFASVANLRDIGGYRTADGRTVRMGRLYRAASLAYVSDEEQARLAALGIRLVCDLRSEHEIAGAPDKTPPGAEYWHLPMLQVADRWREAARMIFVPHYLDSLLVRVYIQMIDHQHERLASIYRRLGQPEALPALVHCTAGKDRTGVTVALLLRFLGVPREAVLADYSQTNHAYDYIQNLSTDLIRSLERLGLRRQDIMPLLLANPATLAAALDHVEARYGSVDAYFSDALRLAPAEIDALRSQFLA
jgi:protein-tyrosine phosphatase